MSNVTRTTRAPRSGKAIHCPHCKNSVIVYHFSWSALQCKYCDHMVDKYDWIIDINPIQIMDQNEYYYLAEVHSILKNVLARESKRHEMDQHLVPGTEDVITEIITMLEEQLDYDPTPQYDPSLAGI